MLGFGPEGHGLPINCDPPRRAIKDEATMAKTIHSPTVAETAYGQKAQTSIARLVAGFTGFAVAVLVIVATTIPVEAHRSICAKPLEGEAICSQ